MLLAYAPRLCDIFAPATETRTRAAIEIRYTTGGKSRRELSFSPRGGPCITVNRAESLSAVPWDKTPWQRRRAAQGPPFCWPRKYRFSRGISLSGLWFCGRIDSPRCLPIINALPCLPSRLDISLGSILCHVDYFIRDPFETGVHLYRIATRREEFLKIFF